ncbi:aminotransferase class I/II-fold pyridoxal phosphate-dependent enzyme [Flavobacterium sp.]|uniref:aminotransferase class I/II-fold pyridoxal phosphate-dependent enzyme n=1 Tax=Flavobacterium sp. TaxID=239 RepID=UPI00286EA6FB|nr:aminotransferase class I/II-fold pyridoxal phosphate-dependent enzyme [Flavobacterium sp.]
MNIVNQFPDRTIDIDNQKFLYFGGTAYLGLPTNKAFQKIIIQNIQKWGTSYGSSRNANIQLAAYEDSENYLAKFIHSEATVTISSGSLAGKLVIEQLTYDGNTFFYLPNVHNAIKANEMFPVYIENQLNSRLFDNTIEKITILTDAIPVTCIEPIDLSFIEKIPSTKEITLVLDESHSLGIIGENGCGYYESIGYQNIKNKIIISSLGKAMGITGGIIGGSQKFISKIKTLGNYVSGAGMNPGYAISITEAKAIYTNQIQKLKNNLEYIDTYLIKNKNLDFNVNYPILYPKIVGMHKILAQHHIIITNFKYPNEAGELNRIIITANHTKTDLKKLITILNNISNSQQ